MNSRVWYCRFYHKLIPLLILLVLLTHHSTRAATIVHRFDFEDDDAVDTVGGLEGDLFGDVQFDDDAMSGNRSMLLEGGSYVRVNEDVDFGVEFSLAMWVQPDSTAIGIQNLIGNGQGGWDSDGWKLYYNTWSDPLTADGAILLETGDGPDFGLPGGVVLTDPDLVIDDVWYHIGATIDVENNLVSMYLDGELLTTTGGLNVDMKTDGPFDIGYMINGWDLHGFMDDIQIYDGILSDDEMLMLFENPGMAIGLDATLPGDYNGDGTVDGQDIDLQAAAMASANPDLSLYDEDDDGVVDGNDRRILLRDHVGTWMGDSDLNGEFNSSDFVTVFSSGKYETSQPATWGEGDWDGDGVFASSDFVAAFGDGGYEVGPRTATQAVPEPSGIAMLLVGFAGLVRRKLR